jgi:tryptophanyl-tRNA synthetase
MSPADPTQKMSKSLGDKHYVGILEDPSSAWKKIRSAVTDTGSEAGDPMSPGVANLFALLRLSEAPAAEVEGFRAQHAAGEIRYGDLKTAVRDHLMAALEPIRERRAALTDDDIRDILADGAARASHIARETMADVRKKVGVR